MYTFKSVYSSSVVYLQLSKRLYRKAFLLPRVCNVCPLVMSSESVLVSAEDCRFENVVSAAGFGDIGHRDACLELDCSQLVVLKALKSKSHVDGQYYQPILAYHRYIGIIAFMLPFRS